MTNKPNTRNVTQEILYAVEHLQEGTGFGSVEIIVHAGRVTQIERKEKQRFSPGKSGLAAADKPCAEHH